jgi:hypothetical protein
VGGGGRTTPRRWGPTLDAEIERASREPITERERKRVITEAEAGMVRGLETLVARGEALQRFNHFLGEPDSFTRVLDSSATPPPRGSAARPPSTWPSRTGSRW